MVYWSLPSATSIKGSGTVTVKIECYLHFPFTTLYWCLPFGFSNIQCSLHRIMSDKPPSNNPTLYDAPSPYPPPPPPYQYQPHPPPTHRPTTTTVYSAINIPGRSTTIVTGTSYGTTDPSRPIVVRAMPATSVLLVGGCPACRVGVLNDHIVSRQNECSSSIQIKPSSPRLVPSIVSCTTTLSRSAL